MTREEKTKYQEFLEQKKQTRIESGFDVSEANTNGAQEEG